MVGRRWLGALFGSWHTDGLEMGFVNQVLSLYWKNALVAWRNRGATILRLLVAPMLFLLLALIIDKVGHHN